ncbi:MAG TPA: SDR family oxidoreductase [Candidatus Acidoferrales bacterium]|nr:SDR family oxidoreductase [Candidatus Acidoferrales bacterium]
MSALRQRVALITGGSRGIGKGIAFGLGREGVRIAISYRSNKAAAQNTLRQLQAAGCECFAVEADATDSARTESLFRSVLEHYGRLDILVNNVGIFNWGTVAEATVEEWRRVLDSNLVSVFYNCKSALPAMRQQRWGRIINLGAVGAERAFGQATISAYTAAKAAVVAFSRSLALEEAKNGITVNVVNPPNIDDKELTLEEARRMRDARFPVGRPPSAEDVGSAVKFLASDSADYITGQVLSVSGGWML